MSQSLSVGRNTVTVLGAAGPAVFALLFGVFIIFGVGFAGPMVLHNAAHDVRHAFALPLTPLSAGNAAPDLSDRVDCRHCRGPVRRRVSAPPNDPLIAAAETYETAAEQHNHANASDHRHDAAAEWEPAPGIERSTYTIAADILAGIGFALMLTGAIALSRLRGYRVDAGRGLLWGAAASRVRVGAGERAAARIAGDGGSRPLRATDLVAVYGDGDRGRLEPFRVWCASGIPRHRRRDFALPHIVGGPPTGHGAAAIPAELAASFVSASLTAAALFWLFLGGLSGWLYRRFEA